MSDQGSLFASPQPREPPPAPGARYRLPLERRPVKCPWGKTDGKGNLFWQKMHTELEKLPAPLREHFNFLTGGTNLEQVRRFAMALGMFVKASDFDRIDFDVSRGLLGE